MSKAFGNVDLQKKTEMDYNVSRATRSLGFGERDVLSSTNVTKVDNVSIKHNTQIFGARCYMLLSAFGVEYFKAKLAELV